MKNFESELKGFKLRSKPRTLKFSLLLVFYSFELLMISIERFFNSVCTKVRGLQETLRGGETTVGI